MTQDDWYKVELLIADAINSLREELIDRIADIEHNVRHLQDDLDA